MKEEEEGERKWGSRVMNYNGNEGESINAMMFPRIGL